MRTVSYLEFVRRVKLLPGRYMSSHSHHVGRASAACNVDSSRWPEPACAFVPHASGTQTSAREDVTVYTAILMRGWRATFHDAFGECQVVAQSVAKRVPVSPLALLKNLRQKVRHPVQFAGQRRAHPLSW